ncbi:MAG: hypothetical protein ACYDB2_11270 [Acidimicrobiales bacterium]
MAASASENFHARTTHVDTWFASLCELSTNVVPGEPNWFSVVLECAQYVLDGRFPCVDVGRLIERTWVANRNGTDGAETPACAERTPSEVGTNLRLGNGGHNVEASARRQCTSRSQNLEDLDTSLREDD